MRKFLRDLFLWPVDAFSGLGEDVGQHFGIACGFFCSAFVLLILCGAVAAMVYLEWVALVALVFVGLYTALGLTFYSLVGRPYSLYG